MQIINKYIAVFIFILGLWNIVASQCVASSIKIPLPNSHQNEVFVLTKINDKLYKVTVCLDELNFTKKNSPYGDFYQLKIPMASFLGNAEGSPSLPSFAKLLPVPANAFLKIKVDSLETENVQLDSLGPFKLFPFQNSESKNSNNPHIFRFDTLTYNSDFFIGDSLVKLESLGTMRGTNLGRIVINPIQYNPVKNILRVVKFFKAVIEIQSGSSLTGNSSKFSSESFARMMNSKFALPNSASPLPSRYPMKYIILADSMFKNALQPFIRWKTEEGFKVQVVYKGAPGVGTTPSQMQAYLSKLYFSASPQDPAPTYLLIVGDNEQLPAFTSPRYGHATDLYYATFDSPDDYYPDMFYGRFSAIDSTTLANQVEKTIEYEKYLFPDPAFLDSAMLISTGNDDNGYDYGNGQINYIANNYANPSHGIYSNTFLWPNSYYASPALLLHMNNGCSFVNYTGHGDVTTWLSPVFNTSEIKSLTNYHKYPLVISNGCITNYFTYPVCFGEALLRGKQTGAIGAIGCTDDSYWDEDYYWAIGVRPVIPNPVYGPNDLGAFDRTFHTHNEPRSEWYPAQGEMSFAGDLAVVESGSRRALYYWEIYTLLGDPSLKVYYGRPDSLHASFPTQLASGSQQIGIYAEPDSYTGLSLRDSLLDGGAVDSSGFILLKFPSLRPQDTLLLVISKQNRKPVITKITSFSPGQAFLEYKGYSLSSENKTINGNPDYGESMKLNVYYKNAGATASDDIRIRLSTLDTMVAISDSILLCNRINALSDTVFTNAFSIKLSPLVADQQEITLAMDVTQNMGVPVRYYIVLTANSPVMEFGVPSYDDKITGNGNSRPDPGEALNLLIPVTNIGHSPMDPASLKISGKSKIVNYTDSVLYVPSILPDSTAVLKLLFHLDTSAIPGIPLTIMAKLDTLNIHIASTIIVRPAVFTEDFETGNLKKLPWTSATALKWYASSNFPLDGNFSARSGKIGDSQTTDMKITLFVTDTGRLQFKYKVSSEDYYDFFKFYVDSILITAVSGQSGLQNFSDTISKGWHTFLWRYTKDEADSYGDDCVWVDDILFPPSVINPYFDGSVESILFPSTDSIYNSAVRPEILIKNSGSLPIEGQNISYQLNNLPIVTENLSFIMLPGEVLNYAFKTPILLPVNQTCTLHVNLFSPHDTIHSNDTLSIVFKNLYLSAEKYATNDDLKFYPNPAGDFIYFIFPKTAKDATLEIISMEGIIVQRYKLIPGAGLQETKLSLIGLASGSYIVSLRLDGQRYIQKFIKN